MRMNKRVVTVFLAAAAAVSLAGCASSDKAYLKNIKASNYVDVCDYVGIEIELAQPAVSDEQVDAEIESDLSSSSYEEEVTDRDDVQDGDIVDIDYVGTLDGEEFDGGSSEGYELEIGSGTFIDGFEEGLIGCTVGETVDLNLTFPEDYSSEDLAGQDVVFTVTINSILQEVVPEFTDEWVQSLGDEDLQTTDDYRQYIYDDLMEDAAEDYESELETLVVNYVIENSTYKKDIPEAMIERLVNSASEYYETYASYYGLELEEFMETFFGTADEEETQAYLEEIAESSAQQLLVLKAISDKEGLNPSKSEWETQLSVYAAYYGYDSISEFKEYEDAESVREDMMMTNVIEFLVENCEAVEPSGDESDEEAADGSEEDVSEEEDSEAEDSGEEDESEAPDEEE